ncbi:MAG TPA: hypothetical protein VFG13_07550, partial [Blastococcus sp.]|nr:hypothetical protein [Blastococcus sp.]
MKNRPAYAIASVDSALLLASLLQQEGAMRVTDVAVRLGVSVASENSSDIPTALGVPYTYW